MSKCPFCSKKVKPEQTGRCHPPLVIWHLYGTIVILQVVRLALCQLYVMRAYFKFTPITVRNSVFGLCG